MKPAVIKKLNFKSGNRSVSSIPLVSITGLTALNKIADVPIRRPIIISFIIIEDVEPDDTENGLTKKRRISRSDTPNSIHEYLVFSLY
jgi:hypothetical protein